MINNLNAAKALIQSDLEHARHVHDLWTQQVEELEKTLSQIDAVGNSRAALRLQFQGNADATPRISEQAFPSGSKPRGRKPKAPQASAAGAPVAARPDGRMQKIGKAIGAKVRAKPDTASGAARTRAKRTTSSTIKYKDLGSEKTWTGHGRPPSWLVGDREQYAVH